MELYNNYLLSGSNPQIIVALFKIQLLYNKIMTLKNPTMKIEHISDSFHSSVGINTITAVNNGFISQ